MNGDDFIQLAGKLATHSEPAALRSAVSRAYYGAFHLAGEFLAEIDRPVPRNANAHVLLARTLQSLGHPDARGAGSLSGDLHSDRIKADYRLDDLRVETTAFARVSVETAHEIRSALDQCRPEPARSQIQASL